MAVGARIPVMWARRWTGTTVLLVVSLAIGFALSACGREEPSSATYTPANRDAFLAACTNGAVDDRLVRDVCECTWSRIAESIEIDELARLEDNLRLDALAPLPELVAEHMADCLVSEAGL